MTRFFVTGTDTDVGKTLACACLAVAWDADYWKPVQTGLAEEPGDTATIAALTGMSADRLQAPRYSFQAPLAPVAAAALEESEIDPAAIVPPFSTRPLLIEGPGGGLMVPLDCSTLAVDLLSVWRYPTIVVARSARGTINHTLLTIEALRARKIPIAGVVMNGPLNGGNRAAIEKHGGVPVIFEIPELQRVTRAVIAELAHAVPPLGEILAEAVAA
ncbi:MAG TPA: dethiobiotin synthase [Inquilinus sp.]|nr:dethiobiotin synthase [Inquilinus sp.]